MSSLINTVKKSQGQSKSINKTDFKKFSPEKVKKEIAKSRQIIREKFKLLKGQTDAANTYFKDKLEPLQKSVTSEIKGLHAPLEKLIQRVTSQSEKENVRGNNAALTQEKNINFDKLITPAEDEFVSIPDTSESENEVNTQLKVFEKLKGTPKAIKYASDVLPQLDEDLQFYIKKFLSGDVTELDSQYGVKFNGKEWVIGNQIIKFSEDNFIIIDSKSFEGSPGLYNLLFMKMPDQDIIQPSDLLAYKRILELSSAHKKTYSSDKNIASNRGYKYLNIIAPLFNSRKSHFGTGVNALQPVHEYYNDLNELVSRLKLLIASSAAGNNSHMNEITSILDQLRMHDIIV